MFNKKIWMLPLLLLPLLCSGVEATSLPERRGLSLMDSCADVDFGDVVAREIEDVDLSDGGIFARRDSSMSDISDIEELPMSSPARRSIDETRPRPYVAKNRGRSLSLPSRTGVLVGAEREDLMRETARRASVAEEISMSNAVATNDFLKFAAQSKAIVDRMFRDNRLFSREIPVLKTAVAAALFAAASMSIYSLFLPKKTSEECLKRIDSKLVCLPKPAFLGAVSSPGQSSLSWIIPLIISLAAIFSLFKRKLHKSI